MMAARALRFGLHVRRWSGGGHGGLLRAEFFSCERRRLLPSPISPTLRLLTPYLASQGFVLQCLSSEVCARSYDPQDNDFLNGASRTVLLRLIERQPAVRVRTRADDRLAPGDVLAFGEGAFYPGLHRLESEGRRLASKRESVGGRSRGRYRLRPAGRSGGRGPRPSGKNLRSGRSHSGRRRDGTHACLERRNDERPGKVSTAGAGCGSSRSCRTTWTTSRRGKENEPGERMRLRMVRRTNLAVQAGTNTAGALG